MHSKCYKSYFKTNIGCPVCKKCPFDDDVKKSISDFIQNEIDNTPMGEELSKIQLEIMCNDCLKKSTTSFHIIALKCQECGSFNTTRIKSSS
mmetsp:Transcript_5162/g.6092  ORF Transcript_5162/g.6092 Transcript_5162/m.6092 type:complete len:92 (+) Transcript_5162:280-555(+)